MRKILLWDPNKKEPRGRLEKKKTFIDDIGIGKKNKVGSVMDDQKLLEGNVQMYSFERNQRKNSVTHYYFFFSFFLSRGGERERECVMERESERRA